MCEGGATNPVSFPACKISPPAFAHRGFLFENMTETEPPKIEIERDDRPETWVNMLFTPGGQGFAAGLLGSKSFESLDAALLEAESKLKDLVAAGLDQNDLAVLTYGFRDEDDLRRVFGGMFPELFDPET